jgi:mRNA interferase MazF
MSAPWPLVRGRVYAAILSNLKSEKYFLVVSNNQRNAKLPQVLAIRLTTTPKPDIPSIVELGKGEAFVGRAVCDDIIEIYEDEVIRDLGALSPKAMSAISSGLRAALAL